MGLWRMTEFHLITCFCIALIIPDVCSLKTDPGPCNDYQAMWYFEPLTQVCRRFFYGGCEGNENKFVTHDECIEFCLSTSTHQTDQSEPATENEAVLGTNSGFVFVRYSDWCWNSYIDLSQGNNVDVVPIKTIFVI